MSKEFYASNEYHNFLKVHARIQEPGGNTKKNMGIYIEKFSRAIKSADKVGAYILERDGVKIPAYKWAPSPQISKPIDYDGSVLIFSKLLEEKISVHRDGSVTCCKSGVEFTPEELEHFKEMDREAKLNMVRVKKMFPGSTIDSKSDLPPVPEKVEIEQPDLINV